MSLPGPSRPILLFDGVCNLCDAAVTFVIDRDSEGVFRFASLQSPAARMLIDTHGAGRTIPDSLVLIDSEGLWVESEAALRVARRLGWPWRAAGAARILPRGLRDIAYRAIARNRYRLFGRREACRIPTPELRARFLDT